MEDTVLSALLSDIASGPATKNRNAVLQPRLKLACKSNRLNHGYYKHPELILLNLKVTSHSDLTTSSQLSLTFLCLLIDHSDPLPSLVVFKYHLWVTSCV